MQVSAFARLLLLGLGTEADDKGTFPWKPVSLKMKLFPLDVVDLQALLKELADVDAIRRYKIDGKEYGAIRNFRQHQRPKKPNDLHPMPDDFRTYVGLTDASGEPVGNQWGKTSADGGEGRGEEDGEERRMEDGGEGRGKGAGKGAALPKAFEPVLSDTIKEMVALWPAKMLEREIAKFKDHHTAKGSIMKDWQAALRTWLRNADEWSAKNGKRAGNASTNDGFFNAAMDLARGDHEGDASR